MSRVAKKVVQYRAGELRPGDVITVKIADNGIVKASLTVEDVYDAKGALRLERMAKGIRARYSEKKASSIGVALFIENKLPEVVFGTHVVVRARVTPIKNEEQIEWEDNTSNWFSFRSLNLIEVQEDVV